jgi:hypothetical protein
VIYPEMSFIVLLAALMSGAWISRYLRPENTALLSPAITIIGWSLTMGILVSHDITIEKIWWPFWLSTGLSFAVSCYAVRDDLRSFKLLLVPALCTIAILFPYFWHGVATYPGSWFWDGFAYLAAGEAFWSYPRDVKPHSMELLFSFGQSQFNNRFISSTLLSILRGIVPIGGDSQNATGYFLVTSVFTFACSCYYLARAALPHRLHIPFVVLTTISGAVLNLVWANNFDHLLALSLSPAVTGYAITLRWGSKRDAAFLGLAGAALIYIYPEMTGFLALPAAFVLASRIVKERPTIPLAISATVAVGVFAVSVLPFATDVYVFVKNQIGSTTPPPGVDRPGTGYFRTLLNLDCVFGGLAGLYTPFQPCTSFFENLAKTLVGLALFMMTIAGMVRRRDAISAAAVAIFIAALFFLLHQHYDYGAFKILVSGCYVFSLLAVNGFVDARWPASSIGAFTSVCLLLIVGLNLLRFDHIVRFKSIETFKALTTVIPDDSPIEIKIKDPLLFQWAEYYLRFHRTVAAEGRFLYFPSPPVDDEHVKELIGQARYLLTDQENGSDTFWSNGTYRVYKIARP